MAKKLRTLFFCGKCGIELEEVGICPECSNNTTEPPYGGIELCADCLVPIRYAQGTVYCPECFAREIRDDHN